MSLKKTIEKQVREFEKFSKQQAKNAFEKHYGGVWLALDKNDALNFFSQAITNAVRESLKILLDTKVIEAPKDVEKLKSKSQAFIAGQMNILMRQFDLCIDKKDKIEKKDKKVVFDARKGEIPLTAAMPM